MKCMLLGKQNVEFEDDKGRAVSGTKLHLVSSDEESSPQFIGRRCASVFTKLDTSSYMVPSMLELIYEPVLGSKTMRLTRIIELDEEATL